MNLKMLIREFPDFPKKGILFRDIGPILRDPDAMRFIADRFYDIYGKKKVDLIAGIESRGFIFACALAMRFNKGFVMIRKQGKLPGKTVNLKYGIEYGNAVMEIQADAVRRGDSVLVADDLLATGGTAKAAAELIQSLGGSVAGFAFVVELKDVGGRKQLKGHEVHSLVTY